MITDLKSCYLGLGGDYNEVMSRLMREKMVQKFVLKFPDDKNYGELILAMQNGDCESAFRAAHTMKGICLNLSFTKLSGSVVALTEALRAQDMEQAQKMLPAVVEDYAQTVGAIREYSEYLVKTTTE